MKRTVSEIEQKTWRAATADTKPLKKKKARVPRVLSAAEAAKKPIKRSTPARLLVRAATAARAYDAKLDLHGLTEGGAHQMLMHWVGQQIHHGARRLLVITGKGIKGNSVLRTNVPRWLDVPPVAQHITAIETAPPAFGGEGAYIIKLKKPH